MRTPQRPHAAGLIALTRQAPGRYEFFQLVRLYELAFRAAGSDPVSERIRFRNSLHLGFAPGQVEALAVTCRPDAAGEDTPELAEVEITPSFLGLLGVQGTLPLHYTERIIERERYARDTAGRAFLDLFTNRSVGHFYRAWKKYKLALQYESDRHKHFLPLLLSIAGLGQPALRGRLAASPGAVDDESLAHLAGLLGQRPLSAAGLARVLGSHFQEPVTIEQFVGRWYALPPEQRGRLGLGKLTLGREALLGERVWQRNLCVGIHIGPLPAARYHAFLPGGDKAAALGKLLALLTGAQFEYEICPILRAADLHPLQLGGPGPGRLGYDSFVLSRPASGDRHDIRYRIPLSP